MQNQNLRKAAVVQITELSSSLFISRNCFIWYCMGESFLELTSFHLPWGQSATNKGGEIQSSQRDANRVVHWSSHTLLFLGCLLLQSHPQFLVSYMQSEEVELPLFLGWHLRSCLWSILGLIFAVEWGETLSSFLFVFFTHGYPFLVPFVEGSY